MIDPLGPETEAPGPTAYGPAVVDSDLNFDLERLTATMAMLEKYVDSLLASDGGPPRGPLDRRRRHRGQNGLPLTP